MRSLRAGLIMSVVTMVSSSAMTNGMTFPAATAKSLNTSVPAQQALITFDGVRETLILQIQFTGEGDDFAWVVPLPTMPEVEAATPNLFPFLNHVTQPRIVTSFSLIVPSLLIALLALSLRVLATRKSVISWLLSLIWIPAGIAAVGFILFSLLFTTMGGGERRPVGEPAVDIHEVKRVGPYDVAVISSKDPRALADWFDENGYFLPGEAAPILNDYVELGWFFVACKLTPKSGGTFDRSQVTPLKFSFVTKEVVYPMRLTSLSRTQSDVLLYVLGEEFYGSRGLKVELKRRLDPDLREALTRRCGVHLDPLYFCITKLYRSFSPSDMIRDVHLSATTVQSEYHLRMQTDRAERWLVVLLVAAVFLAWIDLRLKVPFSKRLPLVCLLFVVLVASGPWDLLVPDRLQHKEQWVRRTSAPEANVKCTMFRVREAAEEFSKMTGGLYPADIAVEVKEVLQARGIPSNNDASIAGNDQPDVYWKGEIGSRGPAILPSWVSNTFFTTEGPAAILKTSLEDPPEWSLPGVVYYVPLDVDGRAAHGYKIYGSGQRGPIRMICTSEGIIHTE
jgi:hypothetical protein